MKWQVDVNGGYGACSTSRGRLFFFDRVEDQARLRCLNAETGKSLWEYKYDTDYEDAYGFDNGPRSSPVVDGDRVYVFGVEGELHCVGVNDGKRVWMVDTDEEFQVVKNFFGVGTTPIIHGDLLIAMVGGSPDEDQGKPVGQLLEVQPNGTGFVAFNKFTGKVVYATGDSLASYSSIRLAKLGDVTAGITLARGGLVGFNAENGQSLFEIPWRAKRLETVNAATPVIEDDLLSLIHI